MKPLHHPLPLPALFFRLCETPIRACFVPAFVCLVFKRDRLNHDLHDRLTLLSKRLLLIKI